MWGAIFGAIGQVSSILTLVAFIIAVLAFVYYARLNNELEKQKQRIILIKSLPQKDRLNVVIQELEGKKKVLTKAVIPFLIVLN